MVSEVFTAATIDDLMRLVLEPLLENGTPVVSTKGANTELLGVTLHLTNPRARLSRTETRGKPFSCLGELCWYLAGSNSAAFISYYVPAYTSYAENGVIFGGYGPRLVAYRGNNQLSNICELLNRKSTSRRAVIQLFDAGDLAEDHEDIPCTCTLQFLLRDGRLHLFTYMRSNDVFIGLPHDIFCFTMLQEIVARAVAADIGTYRHVVGSLHLYDLYRDAARAYLDEGWQSTQNVMPPMPAGDPWPAVRSLLQAEESLRNRGELAGDVNGLDGYWQDLVRLLRIFRATHDRDFQAAMEFQKKMSSSVFDPFISKKVGGK